MSDIAMDYLMTEIERLRKLEQVVKNVLVQNGDDVCWRDVYEEMAKLVGVEFKPKLLPKHKFIVNCNHFYDCLMSGDHYIAPE